MFDNLNVSYWEYANESSLIHPNCKMDLFEQDRHMQQKGITVLENAVL